MIKKSLITGLAILLPIALTVMIAAFVVNILTKPFFAAVFSFFDYFDLFNSPLLIFSGRQVLSMASTLAALLLLVLIIFTLGFLGHFFFAQVLLKKGENLIAKVPLISKIYKAVKEGTLTIFSSNGKAFSKVVLVPFPSEEVYNIGFISAESLPEGSDDRFKDFVPVFVPGALNPTFGFMLLFEKRNVLHLDLKVEDALKLLVSCGAIKQ